MANPKQKPQLKTLSRGLEILDVLSDSEEGLRSIDIARQFDLNLVTAGRLLSTLESSGYATRSKNGRYSLGTRAISAAMKKLNTANLSKLSRPVLESLRNLTKESVVLVIRVGHHLVVVDSVEGIHNSRVVKKPGSLSYLFPSATGYAVTADLPSAEVVSLSNETSEQRVAVNEAEVIKARQELKKNGYLICCSDTSVPGTCTVATTIRLRERVVAALGIIGPAGRWNKKAIKPHIVKLLKATADLNRAISKS